jgi:hypothetical protein
MARMKESAEEFDSLGNLKGSSGDTTMPIPSLMSRGIESSMPLLDSRSEPETHLYPANDSDGGFVVTIRELDSAHRLHTYHVPNDLVADEDPLRESSNRRLVTDAVCVASNARCLVCAEEAVDVQVMPCKHLLHASCLRRWMQPSEGKDKSFASFITKCPVCSLDMVGAVLVVPCIPSRDYMNSNTMYNSVPTFGANASSNMSHLALDHNPYEV